MTRRDLLRLMLASAVAEAVDVERLLWTPKPIITVPAMPMLWTVRVEDITNPNEWNVHLLGILKQGEFKILMNWDSPVFGTVKVR